jgi:uncharacterized protein YggE
MKKILFLMLFIFSFGIAVKAQEAGNVLYGATRGRSPAVTPGSGSLSAVDPKGSEPGALIEASVLMNVKADEYVAVFALVQEAQTVPSVNEKLAAQIKDFITSLERLGVKSSDLFVDYIAQNRVYDVTGSENNARETLTGFELKKNISIRYKDRALLEQLVAAAAKSSIFDLVKVDFVVSDAIRIREQLLSEAAKIIKRKEAEYAKLFGVKMQPLSVDQEKHAVLFPSESYSSYTAYESLPRYNTRVIGKRKTSTFYYNPLNPADFDAFIGPTGVEPVVQFTLNLRVKYAVSR